MTKALLLITRSPCLTKNLSDVNQTLSAPQYHWDMDIRYRISEYCCRKSRQEASDSQAYIGTDASNNDEKPQRDSVSSKTPKSHSIQISSTRMAMKIYCKNRN